ncbi:hypothetical protein GCM10027022_20870 [Alpinimonas psychrophila]
MQDINPLGSAGSWELAIVLGLATWSYAVLSTLAGRAAVSHHDQMLLALVLVTLGVVLSIVASAPKNGGFARFDFVLIVSLALGAALLQGNASSGGVPSIATDWGPLALAGVLAGASSFRPQIDQLWAGFVAATVMTVAMAVEGLQSSPTFGVPYFVITAVAPIVIVTIGQSAYTRHAIRSLKAWRLGFEQTREDMRTFVPSKVGRKIGQDFLTEISVDVQPLFARILGSGIITEGDSRMAAAATERIRIRLVGIAHQTWLERLPVTVHDQGRVAERIDVSARAAVTALVNGLAAHGVGDIVIQLTSAEGSQQILTNVTGTHSQPRIALRTQIAPILRVMYVVFANVTVVYEPTKMTLQFDYGVD